MKSSKQLALETIASDASNKEKFNHLTKLYLKNPRNNGQFMRALNRGYTAHNFERLVYEIKKIYNISDVELATFSPEVGEEKEEENKNIALEDQPEKPFRDEYPFLNEDDVFEEFKILAADKISAFRKVVRDREYLAKDDEENKLSKEERAKLVANITANEELNDLIHRELKHFQENGEILGEHPIFGERLLKKKIEAMTGEEKAKRMESLTKMIKRDKDQAAKAKTDATKQKYEALAAEKELELKLVKKALA